MYCSHKAGKEKESVRWEEIKENTMPGSWMEERVQLFSEIIAFHTVY